MNSPSFAFPFFLLTLVSSVLLSHAYQVTVDIDSEECFFEDLLQDDKLVLLFDVFDGGFRDIRFNVTGPEGEMLYDDHEQPARTSTTGKFIFSAFETGEYTWCFINKRQHTSATPKEIQFMVEVQDELMQSMPMDGDIDSTVGAYVKEIDGKLRFAKYEVEYSISAMVNNRQVSEHANTLLLMWAFFELLISLCMICCQTLYLRKLFEKRAKV